MTRKELFKTLFPEVYTDPDTCLGIACNNSKGCNECKFRNYWNEPVVISKIATKNILNSAYGKSCYLDTDSVKVVYDVYHSGKTHAEEFKLAWQGWTKLPSLHNNIDWSTLNEIMCDAIANGFEVKILNGSIYYREKQ